MRLRNPEVLGKYRRLKGYSQHELARCVRRTQTTIYLLEAGKLRDVSEGLARALARWLECPVEVLFEKLSDPSVTVLASGKHAGDKARSA